MLPLSGVGLTRDANQNDDDRDRWGSVVSPTLQIRQSLAVSDGDVRWPAVRWAWVLVLTPFALISLALAPASGLLTLPFALMTGGLAVIFAQEARGRARSRAATIAALVGLAATALLLLVLVVTPSAD